MLCRKRYRVLSAVVVGCSVTYFFLLYGITLYSLTFAPYKTVSYTGNRGHLYLGTYFEFNNWTCKTLHYSHKRLTLTALASFPGSGNTWVRHILQQATGLLTGSVYKDQILRRHGFPGEGVHNSSVLTIKTHHWGHEERSKYTRAILLIRRPKDALLAEFNRMYGGHIGHAKIQDFSKKWKTFAHQSAQRWFNMTADWLRFRGDLHLMRFENLINSPMDEIEEVLKFLKVRVSSKDLFCVQRNIRGLFKRPNAITTNYELFSKELNNVLSYYETKINDSITERFQKKYQ